jgi:hypothetical protein
MLNKVVYVADGASKKVREGIVAGSVVNREGFEIVTVKVTSINNPDKYVFIGAYKHLTFDTLEEAEKKLEEVIAVNEKVKTIQSNAEKQIKSLLSSFHGDAPYKHLIDKGETD